MNGIRSDPEHWAALMAARARTRLDTFQKRRS